jgi:pyruvate/2-oxoglutarate dehydrogenase complex dihydrolipoamide dehydrogenase (E3) component
MTAFDAIIIGAGQAGPSLAGRLTGAGMTVAFVERHLFGGTCVNTGCMPTKTPGPEASHRHRRELRRPRVRADVSSLWR